MKIFTNLDDCKNVEKTSLALGNFDGVHLGHQELIRRTVNTARELGLKSAVFTFANHPKTITAKGEFKSILYADEKAEILEKIGVDYLFSMDFTPEIQNLSPVDFIDKLLIQRFGMAQAFCGFNYRFGFKAQGDPSVLMKEGIDRGFAIHVLEPFKINGVLVSSTMIRELIEEGKMEECATFMGRHYAVDGEVVVGNKLGKSIGFPTSNILIDEDMITPPNGVYVTACTYNGVRYPSVTNVGVKPTIGEFKKNIETHIFQFDKELYGKNIRVEFLKKIRPEYKFQSVESLSQQIQKDCVTAKVYHRQSGV